MTTVRIIGIDENTRRRVIATDVDTIVPAIGGAGGTPSNTVTHEQAFGAAPAAGIAPTFARGDHTHGTPADPVAAHLSAYDHSQLHPAAHVHAPGDVTGTAVITTDSRLSDARTPTAHTHAAGVPSGLFLRDDGTWAAPAAAGGLGYAINVQALTSSPVDAQTVYFGALPKAPTTTANTSKVYVRKAGTIKVAEVYCYSGTAGTNQAWSLYIRKNGTTDYLIATLSVATNERVFSNAELAIPMAAGDYFEIKGVQPTWTTNPATTIYGGYVYIE